MESLNVETVGVLLERWQMGEFSDFVKEKEIDGQKLINVTKSIVKLWRPQCDADKFMSFLEDLKSNQDKYLNDLKNKINVVNAKTNESQYQTVMRKKSKEECNSSGTDKRVEELLNILVPVKSFLHRNQQKKMEKTIFPYTPMDGAAPRKPRNFFRLSSYEYPNFDLRMRFSKTENYNNRGYYSVKTNNKYYVQDTYIKPEIRVQRRSMSTPEEVVERFSEDHLYEDLCYTETQAEANTSNKTDANPGNSLRVKPCIVKLQELFQSLKFPFFKKNDDVVKEEKRVEINEREGHIYENSDSIADMYDSVHVVDELTAADDSRKDKTTRLPVEEYLVPISLAEQYCDVSRDRDDSLLSYILAALETRFNFKRETNEVERSEISEGDSPKDVCDLDVKSEGDCKWNVDRKPRKANMADRPLPVPIENEPYYMNIDRAEAENLLRGQPDGTFVLRPSSQPNHAYTLSVSCGGAAHNVGVRRRADGRLALGFARRGERSFPSVASLLRHHRRRRLLLVGTTGVLGATTLLDSPQYYQTPTNIPFHST